MEHSRSWGIPALAWATVASACAGYGMVKAVRRWIDDRRRYDGLDGMPFSWRVPCSLVSSDNAPIQTIKRHTIGGKVLLSYCAERLTGLVGKRLRTFTIPVIRVFPPSVRFFLMGDG